MSSTKQSVAPLTDKEIRALSFRGYKRPQALNLDPAQARAILATPTKKTAKAKTTEPIVATLVTEAPLIEPELVALELLGYQPEHIERLSLDGARAIISTRTTRPGSRAHNEAHGNPLPDRYTDDAIREANVDRPVSSGVEVRLDEFTQQCVRGDDPIDALLLKCQAAYPGDTIRLVNPDLPQPAGQAFQQIYDTAGKPMGTGGMMAMRMPTPLYEEAYVKPNLKRSQQMMGAVTQSAREDADVQIAPQDRHYAPVQGKGLTIAPELANL